MANSTSVGLPGVETKGREILYIPGIGSGSATKNPSNLLGRLFGTGIGKCFRARCKIELDLMIIDSQHNR